MSEDQDYNLKKSKEILAPLYPVLEDANGQVIDGMHRLSADQNWPRLRLENIKTRKQFLAARMVANSQRRRVPREERETEVTLFAMELKDEGFKPAEMAREISRLTGFDEDYIRQLLPEQFKRDYSKPSSAGNLELTLSQKEQNSEPIEESEKEWTPEEAQRDQEDKFTIGHNFQRLEAGPAKPDLNAYLTDLFARYPAISEGDEWQIDRLAKTFDLTYVDAMHQITAFRDARRKAQRSNLPDIITPPPRKIEATLKKPELDTWAYRKARMSPIISEMEQRVQNALYAKGYFLETQKQIAIRFVIPDLWFERDPPLAVFIDGVVHIGREDRDEELRELLRKRGVKVLSFAYEAPTKEAVNQVVEAILEEIT